MYFAIDKEEYKRYEKRFKTNHIGKIYYESYVVATILSLIVFSFLGFYIGVFGVENIADVTYIILATLIFVLLDLESVLWRIQYRKQLNKYIETLKINNLN